MKNILKLLKELAEKKTLKQEKKDILDNNNIYYQLAYHGSPYSFDKFTLDHIGSGEGAQAHGWGLYFTLDKKVAEKYKRNLTREKQDVPTIDKELYYNGRKLNKNEKLPYVILYNISSKTKKEKEKFLKNNIEFETGEIKKASQYILDNDLLETFNKNKLKTNKESLYQVEIPNDDVMLFEYKTFKGQPEKVKESLKRIFEKNKMIEGYLPYDMYLKYKDNGFDYTKFNGDEIYKIIQTFFDGDLSERKKQASKLLNEYGIKGIRYYGAQDGECAVVFNDKSIDILNILEQRNNNSQPLGEYNPATHIATLFEGSNFSTPIHEFAHWWRQTINKFAEAGSERAQKDLDILNDFVGAVEGETWNTKKEEMFARSLENYLLRGEAPTEETKGLFKRIKEFMSDVYKSIKQLDVNLSPEMIHFFDSVFSQEMRSSNTSNVATINTYADLKDEIEKERKLLYQDGISEEKASEIINEKYGDKLRRIEEELSQLTAQDYNFDDYLKAKEQYNKQNGLGSQIENKYNSLTDFLNSAIISTNQNIREISEKVYMKYLNIDFAVNQNIKNLNKELEGFNKGILDLKKNHQVDYERVSVAWYNNDLKTIEEITKNYGFSTEFAKVRDVLERLYKQQVEAGVKVGYRENYLPTKIQPGKLKALLNEIANVYGTKVRSEIEKEAIKRGIIVESPEGLSFVNNYIRQTPSLGFGTSFTKERRLERNPIFYNYYHGIL